MEFLPLVKTLVGRGVPFELHLIGDGSERAELETRFQKAGLAEWIRFWGWLDSDQVKARLLELDCFILLSDYEGLPVALLEAMAYGVVPVLTKIGGNSQLVRPDENGFLEEVGNIEDFATAFEMLAQDRERLRVMRLAAWETAQAYSVQRMTTNYLECFGVAEQNTSSRMQQQRYLDPYPILPACRSQYPLWLRKLKHRLLALHW